LLEQWLATLRGQAMAKEHEYTNENLPAWEEEVKSVACMVRHLGGPNDSSPIDSLRNKLSALVPMLKTGRPTIEALAAYKDRMRIPDHAWG